MGLLRVRQKRARGGRGFTFTAGLRALAFLLAVAAVSAAAADARAVDQPALICRSPNPEGLIEGLVDLRIDGCSDCRGVFEPIEPTEGRCNPSDKPPPITNVGGMNSDGDREVMIGSS